MKKFLKSTVVLFFLSVMCLCVSACGDQNWQEKYSFKDFDLEDIVSIEICEYQQSGNGSEYNVQAKKVVVDNREVIKDFFDYTYKMEPQEKTGDKTGNLYRFSFKYNLQNGTSRSFRFNANYGQSSYAFLGRTGKVLYKHYVAEFSAEMAAKAVELLYPTA